jgi:hypothetical protein
MIERLLFINGLVYDLESDPVGSAMKNSLDIAQENEDLVYIINLAFREKHVV